MLSDGRGAFGCEEEPISPPHANRVVWIVLVFVAMAAAIDLFGIMALVKVVSTAIAGLVLAAIVVVCAFYGIPPSEEMFDRKR